MTFHLHLTRLNVYLCIVSPSSSVEEHLFHMSYYLFINLDLQVVKKK